MLRKLSWLVALWGGGVLTVGIAAYAMRALLPR